MSEFTTHLYTARAYTAEETISSNSRTHLQDLDEEMKYHMNAAHVQVSGLTQAAFDRFAAEYADNFKSIYFFQNPQVKDLSALGKLRNVEYLLFYNLRSAQGLWDMRQNQNLKGIFLNDRKLCHDLSPLTAAPALEEVLIAGPMDGKFTVRSLNPLKACQHLKRVMLNCNTEDKGFSPEDYAHLEVLKYRVDRKRNY